MMQFTEEQRKALIMFASEVSSDLRMTKDTSDVAQNTVEIFKIALAALTAEPVAYMYRDKLHADARFSMYPRFGNWSQEDIDKHEITETRLYTTPPVAALRLPDEKWKNPQPGWESEDSYPEGWNACLAEVKRLNATAPAAPEVE